MGESGVREAVLDADEGVEGAEEVLELLAVEVLLGLVVFMGLLAGTGVGLLMVVEATRAEGAFADAVGGGGAACWRGGSGSEGWGGGGGGDVAVVAAFGRGSAVGAAW